MKKSVKSILNGLVVPILIVDGKMRISYMNAASMAHFTNAKADMLMSDIIENQRCLTATKRVLDGDPETQVEVTLQGVVPTSFRVNVAPMTVEAEKDALHAILSFEDISHIREAEQMRHDFVANVSHELRSPLTALVGFIETLQGPAKGDAVAAERFLGMMERESDRMARLIDDLLSLSKLQARERDAPSAVVDIADVINDIVVSLGGSNEHLRERIKVSIVKGETKVIGDKNELGQVFQNLIENAIKYSPDGSDVVVTACAAEKSDEHICVCVTDQGDGIDPVHIPRLTERFYRIDKGRSRAIGGTGLGLAIVKHILIHHRGSLKIKSKLGEGSTFSVYLPAAQTA
ncbi:histidine kinase [Amylibacter kogurei]|uniref:histidine kinase n=1 Tax=Paramylibacter kogurei TaxID=1889778 RepID=A0A2G5K1X0_9RHOB|nr:ATP-binding protein [Amylibacter kogurei]PIB23536.1 histidine kinase [Amylibacter kogurei]